MYRLLNKEARTPLPVVIRAIRRFERSASSAMSDYAFRQECIAILHAHNWRVRDYRAELLRRARHARRIQSNMCKRPRSA